MRLFIVFVLLLSSLSLSAQIQFKEAASKKTGSRTYTKNETGKVLTLDGKTWEIFETDSGSEYIEQPNAKDSSKMSVIWIGTDVGQTYNGYPVRKTKTSGRYFYVFPNPKRAGCISKKYLEVVEN